MVSLSGDCVSPFPLKEGRASAHPAVPAGCKSPVWLQVMQSLPRACPASCLLLGQGKPGDQSLAFQHLAAQQEKSGVTLLRNTAPKAEGAGVSRLWVCAAAGTAPWEAKAPWPPWWWSTGPPGQGSPTQLCCADGLLCNSLLSSSHVIFYGKNYSMCSSCLKWPIQSIQNKF